MSMVPVKGIPTGAPVLDASAVWTPPIIGPHDAVHLWLAHSLDGVSSTPAIRALPDMIGGLELFTTISDASTLDKSGGAPVIKMRSAKDRLQASAPESENSDARTVLFVAELAQAGSRNQISTVGYLGIQAAPDGQMYLQSTRVGVKAAVGLAVYVVKYTISAAEVWINGTLAATTAAVQKYPANQIAYNTYIGGNTTTPPVEERFGCLKIWNRALSDDEVAAAVADAKRLFKIA